MAILFLLSNILVSMTAFGGVVALKNLKRCEPGQFRCDFAGVCIDKTQVCNGRQDCVDGSDEFLCLDNICKTDQFKCKYGACIDNSLVCDTIEHCADGSDELDTLCKKSCNHTNFECADAAIICKPSEHPCTYGACVERSSLCDGVYDCHDFSDEQNALCESAVEGKFKCNDGEQIPMWKVCDGNVNCNSLSDETPELCGNFTCHSGQFRCAYGACLTVGSICDSKADCWDSSDETKELCSDHKCAENEFQCAYGGCIRNDLACNGRPDCIDNSDETSSHCKNKICAEYEFQCQYGACTSPNILCDKEVDCFDGSDETLPLCDFVISYSNKFQFKCKDGNTTEAWFLCDSVPNCPDWSDESEEVCRHAACHPGQFKCTYGACMYLGKTCDGRADCIDMSDETVEMCGNKSSICEWDQYQCANGGCVPESKVCDGEDHCGDGSDESEDGCKVYKCVDNEFRCEYGACIDKKEICNGMVYCADGSDEVASLCSNKTCDQQEFRCAYGACIPKTHVCNGLKDCSDNSDEDLEMCQHIKDRVFHCTNATQIHAWQVCDGTLDCQNESDEDERLCSQSVCHSNQFKCKYGACLLAGGSCDGIAHCADGSDETSELCKRMRCRRFAEFQCGYGACVSEHAVCNGTIECADKSDEAKCEKTLCPRALFRCKYGGCLDPQYTCDGKRHCADGSDELVSVCHERVCQPDKFQCHYGACIDKELVCNGRSDCADNSDELLSRCQHIQNNKFFCDGLDAPSMDTTNPWQVCDGRDDCPTGHDETLELCSSNSCHSQQFRCNYGACLYSSAICNGVPDCYDGSDESPELCSSVRCILPSSPENGYYTVTEGPRNGPNVSLESTTLNIVCQDGYAPDYESPLFCTKGKWSVASFPKCVRYCTLPNSPSVSFKCLDPGMDLELSRPCRRRELSGAVALPSCSGPIYYAKHALPHMTCINGTWDTTVNCTIECGRVTPDGKKLLSGGDIAQYGELPWHAGIYSRRQTKNYVQICSGSLINNNVIISAAHCFWGYDATTLMHTKLSPMHYAVAVGKLHRSWNHPKDIDVQKSTVSQLVFPKNFDGQVKNYQADIAIVVLTRSVEFKPHIRPVCLSFDEEFESRQLQPENKGKVAGWGVVGETDNSSPVLKVVDLPYVNSSRCTADSPINFREFITLDKFCVGYLNSGIALCKGDSGGGVVFLSTHNGIARYFLRGVVSTAPKNHLKCNVNVYTAMTRVSLYERFIAPYY